MEKWGLHNRRMASSFLRLVDCLQNLTKLTQNLDCGQVQDLCAAVAFLHLAHCQKFFQHLVGLSPHHESLI